MTWGGWWRNKFQTQLSFSGPVVKGKCSWQPFRKNNKSRNKVKPPQQDNILRIPNCWRSAIQNDSGKSNPSRHSGHQHQSTTDKCGRAPGGKRILLSCLWEFTLATVSRMDSFWMPEKKKTSQIKTRIWHSHTLAYVLRKPLIKRHGHPNKASALLPIAEPHYQQNRQWGTKAETRCGTCIQ